MSVPQIHPAAAEYPLLPDDEIDSMAQDIAANGQQLPIVLHQDGRLVDGRNRLEACRQAAVEPIFTTKQFADDDEVYAYVLSANVETRSLSNGQKAMFRACELARQGKRKGGRWERGSIDNTESRINGGSSNTWQDLMRKAGLVLDVAARAALLGDEFAVYVEQPVKVKAGTLTLDAAYRIAQDYEAKAAMKEMALFLPLTKSAGELEQLSIEAEKNSLPIVDAPLTKAHRKQLEDTAKRFAATATAIRAYLRENK